MRLGWSWHLLATETGVSVVSTVLAQVRVAVEGVPKSGAGSLSKHRWRGYRHGEWLFGRQAQGIAMLTCD